MKISRICLTGVAAIVILAGGIEAGWAQRGGGKEIEILEVNPFYAQAPNNPIPGSKARKASSRGEEDWMIVDFSYNINVPEGVDFLEEAEFRVYVEVPTKADPRDDKFKESVVLTGDVTYVNLPMGENRGSLYIPPQTIQRYGGRKVMERRKNPPLNIHVEAFANRRQVDSKSMNEEKGQQALWFQKLPNIDGQIYRQNQCPFIASDTILYPPIKIDNR